MILLLWLIKLCVKVVNLRTASGEQAGRPRTEFKTNPRAIEEDMWPLLEEMSEYEDMEEEEHQDPDQGVDTQNSRRNSISDVNDNVGVSNTIRVGPEQSSSQIPIPLASLNEMIDRRMQIIKTDMLFTRKSQLSRFIERKKLIRKQRQNK